MYCSPFSGLPGPGPRPGCALIHSRSGPNVSSSGFAQNVCACIGPAINSQKGRKSLNAARDGSNLCPTGPCNGNTYPGTYDALGRYLYAGVTLDF